MEGILLIFSAFGLFLILLPLDLTWRLVVMLALLFAIERLISGPVHWSDQGLGYALGQAILTLIALIAAAAIAVRMAIAAGRGGLTMAVIRGPETPERVVFDRLLAALLGAVTALLLGHALATVLAGTSWGRTLDLAVLGLALCGAGIALVALRAGPQVFAASGFLGLAAIAAFGAGQSDRILTGAQSFAEGDPWCLATGARAEPITAAGQLGFFSLQKAEFGWHLVVLAHDGAETRAAHWSVRSQAFVPTRIVASVGMRACHARTDYAQALAAGQIDTRVATVGPHTYAVPEGFAPEMLTDRVRIRSDAYAKVTWRSETEPGHLELRHGAKLRPPPDEARPLSAIDTLRSEDRVQILAGTRFVADGPYGGDRHARISCLRGRYSDQNCSVEVETPEALYEFDLRFADIARWAEAADEVIALFADFRRL
ncbi:MAG: hypothetical protein AAFQ79_08825 [Pseudomonadota bacterium]